MMASSSFKCFDILALQVFKDLARDMPSPMQETLHIPSVAIKRTKASGIGLQEAPSHAKVTALCLCQIRRRYDAVNVLDRVKTRQWRTPHTRIGWLFWHRLALYTKHWL